MTSDDPRPCAAFRGAAGDRGSARRRHGHDRDGIPFSSSSRPRPSSEPRSSAQPGRPEHVDALGPLPDAADEAGLYRRSAWPARHRRSATGGRAASRRRSSSWTQIRGDLHAHTLWSDGKATVLEMATAARDRGYDYLAICDHTPDVTRRPGSRRRRAPPAGSEIAAANEQLAPFRILRGVECDIRADGSLDLPDDVLAELEWVQLSLHAASAPRARELTARVVEAMRHPAARCLSHPTGRLIGHRPENALDLERTVEVALETGVALEVNGLANRLDLSGEHVRVAVEAGVRDRLLDGCPLDRRAGQHGAGRAHCAPGARDSRRRAQHPPAARAVPAPRRHSCARTPASCWMSRTWRPRSSSRAAAPVLRRMSGSSVRRLLSSSAMASAV